MQKWWCFGTCYKMNKTYRHCSKENDQAQKASISLYWFSSIFAFYFPSATHFMREKQRERHKENIYERGRRKKKNQRVIGRVLSLPPPVIGGSGLLRKNNFMKPPWENEASLESFISVDLNPWVSKVPSLSCHGNIPILLSAGLRSKILCRDSPPHLHSPVQSSIWLG